jgi:hypothetical protein
VGGALLLITGTQTFAFGVCARIYAYLHLGDRSPSIIRWEPRLRLERGLIVGSVVAAIGLGMLIWMFTSWVSQGFGSLGEERVAVLGATIVIIGIQVIFASFLVTILGLRRSE